ncbi:MAG: type II toxin-antitoxin system PemK/MazF family toxin [bacterium]
MATFVKSDIVVIPFPFSDLTQAKRRPTLVLAAPKGNDLILCQITSQKVRDDYAIPLDDSDFQTGSFKQTSNIRPNRIFTADKVGEVKRAKTNSVIKKIIHILETE